MSSALAPAVALAARTVWVIARANAFASVTAVSNATANANESRRVAAFGAFASIADFGSEALADSTNDSFTEADAASVLASRGPSAVNRGISSRSARIFSTSAFALSVWGEETIGSSMINLPFFDGWMRDGIVRKPGGARLSDDAISHPPIKERKVDHGRTDCFLTPYGKSEGAGREDPRAS